MAFHRCISESTIRSKSNVTISNIHFKNQFLSSFSNFPSLFKLMRRSVLLSIFCDIYKPRSCLYKQVFSFYKICFILDSVYYISVGLMHLWVQHKTVEILKTFLFIALSSDELKCNM